MASFFLFDDPGEFCLACAALCYELGIGQVATPAAADLVLAPRLTQKIPASVWRAPRLGTLIFHPSALPYRRGPDAIRQTIAAGERVSAATWFWCDNNLDTGPICEQELVVLKPGGSAGAPITLASFRPPCGRSASPYKASSPATLRSVAQDEELASYESFL